MPPRAYGFILIGLIAISFASIFIRYAQDAGLPSLLIAAGRLVIASLVLTPFALRGHRQALAQLERGDLVLAGASGVLLAVHFATWIASLEHTSVLISVVLVTTSPLWVALLEFVSLRARLRPLVILGLIVALTGGILIGAGGDSTASQGSNTALGGALALMGAVAIAVYLVIGRKLRARLSLLPYVWLVYSCAAVVLVVTLVLSGTRVTGYAPGSYMWIVLLALVPQLMGHTSLNYALRFLSATYVSIVSQMEPVASAVAAAIIFGELPAELQVLGSVLILAGVVLSSLGQQSPQDSSG